MTRNERTTEWVRQVWPVGLKEPPDFLMAIFVNMIHAREDAMLDALRYATARSFDEARASLRGDE